MGGLELSQRRLGGRRELAINRAWLVTQAEKLQLQA
jgi:hypothetical protein